MEKELDIITAAVTSFVDIIGYALDADIQYNKKEDYFNVNFTGENLGALIGYHGKNIQSIEIILNLIVRNVLHEQKHYIVLDVSEYRKLRMETIQKMIAESVKRIEISGRESKIGPLPAYERLFVHTFVKDQFFFGYITESSGVEPNRCIIIKKAEEELL